MKRVEVVEVVTNKPGVQLSEKRFTTNLIIQLTSKNNLKVQAIIKKTKQLYSMQSDTSKTSFLHHNTLNIGQLAHTHTHYLASRACNKKGGIERAYAPC